MMQSMMIIKYFTILNLVTIFMINLKINTVKLYFCYLIYDEKYCFINFDIDQINNHLKSIESSLEELNLRS